MLCYILWRSPWAVKRRCTAPITRSLACREKERAPVEKRCAMCDVLHRRTVYAAWMRCSLVAHLVLLELDDKPLVAAGAARAAQHIGERARPSTCTAQHSTAYQMLCFALLCFAMLCYAMLCYAMLWCAPLVECHAVLCYAVLCYAVLCYATVRASR